MHYRRELKHVVTIADALVLKRRLAPFLTADPEAGPDGKYHIRSLYFDNPQNRALFDKLDGMPIKEKYRIRMYNHDPGYICLEKKVKHYAAGAKMRARLEQEEVRDILRGDLAFLKESDQALLREFYLRLRTDRLLPRTVVDYRREAYFCPAGNVRVTIDSDIRASISSIDLFDPDLPAALALDSDRCIVEVKYDRFLPEYIQDIVQLNKTTSSAVSKYAACRLFM